MTQHRSVVSLLIIFHLVALVVASLPDADELNPEQPRRAIDNHTISAAVTPALDRGAAWLRAIEPRIVNAAKPLRVLTQVYISVGLRQTWNMFSNPMTADQYVRVDHYVESTASPQPVHLFRELALPAQREDQIRLVHKFRDKAVLNALEAFSIARTRRAENQAPPRDLEPLGRYFRNRFARDYLNADERVVRTDVWFGQAAIPPPGERLTPEQRESRLAALVMYWHGATEVIAGSTPPKPGALQREDAIVWRLEYVDQP